MRKTYLTAHAFGMMFGLVMLTVVMVALKFLGYFSCSWWLVFTPLLSVSVMIMAVGAMTLVVFFIVKMIGFLFNVT